MRFPELLMWSAILSFQKQMNELCLTHGELFLPNTVCLYLCISLTYSINILNLA
jgi:hypothetical protein